MDYTAYVDPRQGTDSTMTFSRGNTLPVVSTPFGMNAWVLETFGYAGDHSNWFYSPRHRGSEIRRGNEWPPTMGVATDDGRIDLWHRCHLHALLLRRSMPM